MANFINKREKIIIWLNIFSGIGQIGVILELN